LFLLAPEDLVFNVVTCQGILLFEELQGDADRATSSFRLNLISIGPTKV
jgi:hypothetical protein